MTAKLTILLSGDVLAALRATKSMTIAVASGGRRGGTPAQAARAPRVARLARPARAGRRGRRGGAAQPREGSLPARILGWAKARAKPFGTAHVTKQFKLSRAHASMLLSRLASGPYAIRREKRGLYRYGR